MQIAFCVALIILLFKGAPFPVRFFGGLTCLGVGPVAFGIISYNAPHHKTLAFDLHITLIQLIFVVGSMVGVYLARSISTGRELTTQHRNFDGRYIARLLKISLVFGCISICFQCIDYVVSGGGLSDVVALREQAGVQRASVWAKFAMLTSWAGIFTAIFAIHYRRQLSSRRMVMYLFPLVGLLLLSLFSAGRQAAMQILIILLFAFLVGRRDSQKIGLKTIFSPYFLCLAGPITAYLAWITIERNDGNVSNLKYEVLARLFNFEINNTLMTYAHWLPSEVFDVLVEFIVYFSNSIPLYAEFLQLDWSLNFGVFTFPFLMRQLEPLTGMSVLGSLQSKIRAMNDAGVMGFGWTGTFSAWILDFGIYFAFLMVAALGLFSSYYWVRARHTRRPFDVGFAIFFLINIFYFYMFPAVSETQIFLLFLVLIGFRALMLLSWQGFRFSNLVVRVKKCEGRANA